MSQDISHMSELGVPSLSWIGPMDSKVKSVTAEVVCRELGLHLHLSAIVQLCLFFHFWQKVLEQQAENLDSYLKAVRSARAEFTIYFAV